MRNAISTLLLLTGLVLVGSGRAATVTSTADNGPGSLRQAIVNAAPGATIDFAIGGTITLTSGELLIDKSLTIAGPGASSLLIQRSTVNGAPNFRIFNLLSGNVTLSGLTVSNGREELGAGIYSSTALTLKDCVVTGNVATESGGGVFTTSTMLMSNCVIRANSAAGQTWEGYGGGIYNADTLTVINSTISSNSVTSGTGGGSGGGLCNDGTLTLVRSVIKDNSATGWPEGGGGFGGGVYNGFGSAYMDESTLNGNVAQGGGAGLGEGGGVANYLGTLELNRSTVSANSAVGGNGGGWGEGGGIANDYGTVYVASSTVSGNISSGAAGAAGGGIFNDSGTIDLSYSTITANAVPGSSPGDGGGIFNLWGSVEFVSTIIAANLATVDFFNGESGFLVSYGFNLVGSTSGFELIGSGAFFVPGPAEQFNVTAAALKLGPLQDNGGPTFTHALLCGSLAIDAGDNAYAPLTDQRGFARIVSGIMDIGAYEGNNTLPIISCPAPLTLSCAPAAGMSATLSVGVTDPGGESLVVVWTVDGTAAQTNAVAAGGPPTAASIDFTALFGLGSHEVTVSVSGSSGCQASCSTSVEVAAFVPPTVNCPTVPNAAADANCQAAVPNVLGGVTVSGVCSDTNTITLSQSPVAGTLVGLGPHLITVTATDAAGNQSTCTATFTVTDNTPPTITICANNQTAFADATCHALIPQFTVQASDCSGPVVVIQSPAVGTSVGLGATTITLRVRDAANNESTCIATFTVTDNTPPVITSCAPDQSALADATCHALVPVFNVVASDCNGPVVVTQTPLAGTSVGLGATTITLHVKDAANNESTCTATFTVTDNMPPTITSCAPNQSAVADATCHALVPDFSSGVVASDCNGSVVVTQMPVAGTSVGLGVTTITLHVKDAANNESTCTATFTVTDNTPPTITSCAPNQSAFADATCHALVPEFTVAANDCNGPVVVTQTPAAGTSVGLGVTTITLHVKDAANNESTCTATLTVTDNMAPTIANCAPNQSAFADATCHALLPDFSAGVVASDCNGPVVVTQTPLAGTSVGLGVTTITLHVKDAANNESTCTATFTVTDNTPPSITSCAPNQSAVADATCQVLVPDFSAGVVASDCNGPVVVTQTPAAGTSVGLGVTTITLHVKDAANNESTCTATFTVTDNTPPAITSCAPNQSAFADATCHALVPVFNVVASDCNGPVVVTQTPAAGTSVELGVTTITLHVKDAANNESTCTATFTVTDNTAPTIANCAPNQSAFADATCHVLVPDFTAGVVASDCNGPVVVTQTPAAGTSIGLGVTTITLHIKDAANNESTCTATFTVTDNTAPTITSCAPNQSAFADATCHALVPVFNVVATDCNGPVVVTQTPAAGTSVGPGVTTITLHVKDAANNESTCTATFTVTDNTAPTITSCAPNQNAFADATCHALVPVFNVVANDCNGPVVVTQTPAAGTSVGLGVTTITLHVKDAANNESTCTATFTVTDNTAPTITTCAPNQSVSAGANCQAAVPDFTVGVLATDCNGPLVITQSPVAGTLVGLGTTTVTLTVRDASGNSATCSATFTVTGNASLTLTCPSPISTNANANCQAVVPNILSGLTASGTCSGAGNIPLGNLTLSQSPAAGTLVGVGTQTITATATDGAGNSASCTTTFTVIGANAAISILTLTENSNNDLPTGPHIVTDSIVNWTYLVTSTGCEALTNITVTDSVAGVIPAYQGGDANLNGRLDPGETWTYAASGLAGLGQYTNLGTVTAKGTVTSAPVTGSNPDHYFGDPTPCPAGLFTYSINSVTGDLEIKFYQFPAPNDNSYGNNAVGWEKGHTFTQLVQSDKAGFQLRNPSGVVKLDFWIDALSEKPGTPSGYGSLGPWGGDGSVIVGTLGANDITFDTSIARNLNNLGYFVNGVQTAATKSGVNSADLLIDSPPTLDKYRNYTLKTPNPWANGWDFKNSYYVTIKKAKLDSLGFNAATWRVEPDLAGLHNSPAKPCPIGVVGAQFIPATGGDEISADGAVTNAFTTLTGPVYSEDVAGQIGLGTIVINASPGFAFDTGGTPPAVLVAKLSGTGNQVVQGSITSRTATQITYAVTSKSVNQSSLAWQNIRVRATSGTPLASGYLSRSGTANVVGLPTDSNLGTLQEIAGAPRQLAMLVQPSATAMAGVPFAQQPAVLILDQFGNLRSSANGVDDHPVVTAARLAGSGALQGTTSAAGSDGVVVFTNLSHNVATNITLQFTIAGATPAVSDPISVSSTTLSRLGFATQPGNAVAGSAFGTQPVIWTQDQFGNVTTAGLPASLPVAVSLSSGTGPLQGTTTFDLGTAAGNGNAVFSDLRIDAAGTNKQLTASASGLNSGLSAAFAVNPGPAGSLVIQTQPPTTVTAGATFSPAVVRVYDAFGNLVTTGSQVVTATRNAGTASLQGTTSVTAVNGVATFATLSYTKAETITINFTSGALTSPTSTSVTVNPAAASKLTLQAQPSATATAGAAFAQQPVIRIEDAYGNLRSSDNSTVVTVARSAGSGTLQGTLTATAVNGVVSFANLSHNLANTISLSFTASGLTGATSSSILVSPAAFAKLQLLVPGETAAPATASGKTGTPTSSTAGTAFNITVNAVDSFWNVLNTVTDTVDISSSDASATLPVDTALVSGTKTLSVTFKTAGSQTLTASDVTDATKSANTSPAMTVNAGAFAKLQLLVPGETAAPGTATGKTGTPTTQTSGTAFNVTVNAVDANWNLVSSTNTVGITTTDSNDTHPANAALTAGTRPFAVTFKSVGSWTITAANITDGTKTANTSPSITANAGAFTKLQILVPGETAAPGSSTGKAGTPTAQLAGTPFTVTVNAVDANWNPINTVTDTVGITSSDANAELPANTALVSGTQALSVTLRTTGTRTLTASDLTDGSKTANTSSSITVNAGPFAKLQVLVPGETAAPGTATGKTGTPTAQAAGTAFNVTIRSVDAAWNLISSTHTVGLTSSDATAVLPANGALAAGLRTVSLTLKTTGSQTATGTDITDGTKTANTSPAITVNAGAASKLVLQTQTSTTATAGAAFAQQPVIRIEDANGNLRSSDNSTVVTVARSAGSGTLQGTLTATAVNGIATFANLSHNVANTISLSFTATGLTSATSGNILVSPGAFAKLQLLVPGETAAPGSASGKTGTPTASTAATAFNITVNAVDSFWNVINTVTDTVDISSSDAYSTLPADAALVSGTKTLSVTFKTSGSQTLTATDVTDGSKTANTSPSITVNAGAFVKLQLLVPGETAAPGSATGKTGTPTAQSSGAAFNVTVNAVDANWNIASSSNTVGITTTDSNDAHPANAALSAGTRTFAVTFKSVGSWTITASNITDATKTANTSPAITANAGAFAKLQILLPGETAAPGTATGKTGTPTVQTASTPFNVTVNAVDANWNALSTVTDTVGITSSDANAVLPANAGLVAGTQTFSVTLKTAGSRTLTASDVTDGSKTANTSSSVTVNAGAFVKLQLLVPGETAAPGTASGKTGTPSVLASGTAYNVTIRSVDALWNLVSSTHTVGITSSDSTATLPANGALAAGTRTASVTLRTLGSQTVTATDITDGSKTANTSPSINVIIGTANKLTIQTQPSSSATAGVDFAQQPIIRVEDTAGNLVTTDNGRVITATRSAGTGALQGTVTATTVNGIATFANLSHNVATTITLSFTASGLTNATSGNIVVSPDTAAQLTFTTQPAGTRTGSPLATQPVVKAVDQFGNASSVGLPANFNVSLALTSGSGSLLGTTSLDIGSAAGNGTATFTNVECSDAGTNKQFTASAAGFANAVSAAFTLDGVERATGGMAIQSSTAGGTYTTLTGPVYYEYASGDIGTGTIILNAPAGFVFDTGGTAPTVRIDRLIGSGSDNKNINTVASGTSAAITSRTTTQITFTVSGASSSGINCSLTWQNIRVRPAAASPLASGNITKTGTSVMAAVNNSSTSFGRLVEFGPPARLVIQTQPSSAATAGVAFAQQPVIRVEDAAGNLLTANNTTVVTATRSAGSGTLQGTTSRTAVNGLVTFTDLAHNVAGNITITFASGTLTNATSTAIAVSPAAASQLAFTTQPANGTYGSTLATQPVLRSRDQFGNDSTIGLAANMGVTVALTAGTGPLLGTMTLDIGISAGNGVISFTDLQIDSAGANKQLTASATGMSSATSSVFTVAKANQILSFGALSARTYGDASFPIGAGASSGLPVSFSIVSGPATISGNSVTLIGAGIVTVRASQSGDANWNAATSVDQSFSVAKLTVTGSITASGKVYDGTTAATIATRTLSGVLGADNVILSGGTAIFADKNVGTSKAVAATGLSLSGTAAGNYQLASTSAATTADITPATLIGNVTAGNKTYDGTTTAILTTRTLSGVVGGDVVSLVGGTAAFSDKTVGAGKGVTATGLSLSGAEAGNYQLASTSAATTGDITVRTLAVSATGANKVYDGTTAATVTLSDDRVSGDVLTTSSATASFADKNVGPGKTVSVSGIAVTGADAVNYSFNTTATSTADITARTLTVTAVGQNKVYDGTTTATVTLMDDRVENDDLTVSYTAASFADKNVQNGKLVSVTGISVSGTDAGNYTPNTEASTVADITGATLTVVGITAQNKVYDGTTDATLNLDSAEVVGLVDGDDVTVVVSVAVGAFADAEVGTGKLVTVSGFTLIGADAGKYTLTQPTTTADITPAP